MDRKEEKTQYEEDVLEYERLAALAEGKIAQDDFGVSQFDLELVWEEMMGFDSLDDDPYDYYSGGSFDIVAGANLYAIDPHEAQDPGDESPVTIHDVLEEMMGELDEMVDSILDESEREEDEDYDLIDEDPPKCEDCKGTGVVELFNSREACDTCGGSGY